MQMPPINNIVGDVIEVMLSTNAADMGDVTGFSIDIDHSSSGAAWTNPGGPTQQVGWCRRINILR